jgi:two-component system chemotaxis response regulator CheY
MKLLIVDDSSLVRKSIQRQLDKSHITEILQAGNGREAIQLFRQHLPDFVTMDITMPEVDGLQCVTEMMAIKPDTKLMIISALGDAETAIEAVERGANEYVTKPFTAEELNTALRHLIEGGS